MAAIWGLLGFVGGSAVALYVWTRLAAARGEVARLTPALAAAEAARDEHLARVHGLERELLTVTGELQREVARLQGDVEHERALAAEKLQAVEQANARAAESFKALSGDALKDATGQLVELATAKFGELRTETRGELDVREKNIEQMVGKVNESLTQVATTLETLDRDRRQAQGALQEHLRAVVEGQERLRLETGSLVSALRKPDVRGRWGEMQLKRVVELAGMTAYCDFVKQPSIDGDDGRLRPDLIVRMPGGKKVVVDAKVPLESYLDAHVADDPEQRAMHLRAHARQVREHIRKLSARSYWSQFDEAPDFVVLFLPGEHFLNGALEAEPTLIEEGVNQCVMLATPTTLITLLRAVAYGWQQEKVAEGARAVSEIGRELHGRLAKLAEHLQVVGKRLRGTVSAYNDAVGSLDGRVLPAARKFADHGAVSAGKELRDVDPVDLMPRTVQAPELEDADEAMRALLPAPPPDAEAA